MMGLYWGRGLYPGRDFNVGFYGIHSLRHCNNCQREFCFTFTRFSQKYLIIDVNKRR